MPYIITDICILCGACSAGCPTEAITEDETQAQIDMELCIECGTCESNCPVEAIIYVTDLEEN
jgi:ferredoxin